MDRDLVGYTELRMKFTGNAREYFRVWIVNIALLLVTFGIYYPWAKVRNTRYLYTHTQLNDTAFDYLGQPKAILKGWLIVWGIFLASNITGDFFPIASAFLGLAVYALIPIVVVRALMFRLHNTSYRNIRFGFERAYSEAIKIYIGLGLLVIVTLGLIVPYYTYRQRKFVVENTHYGIRAMTFKGSSTDFNKVYLVAGVWSLLLFIVCLLILQVSAIGTFNTQTPQPGQAADIWSTINFRPPVLLVVAVMAGGVAIYSYVKTALYNTVLNSTQMRGVRFRGKLEVLQMAWIYISNAAAVTLTLGLMVPWARVRRLRYQMENTVVYVQGDMNSFMARESDEQSATGDQMSDVFNVDVGL